MCTCILQVMTELGNPTFETKLTNVGQRIHGRDRDGEKEARFGNVTLEEYDEDGEGLLISA